ncbi:hypothetical protein GGI07_000810 [Coemansia sp. Benny D115]|nr:hypothetical protein GGI07_000810 [Coemansia sp. Benny D115]
MAYESFEDVDREELKLSPEGLRSVYAAQASINTNFEIPSIPNNISNIHQDTVDAYGKDKSLMAVSNYQGVLQNFFVGLVNAKRVLEIGTFTGTSAIFFANGLKRNGVSAGPDSSGNFPVVSLEISEEYAGVARRNIENVGVGEYVDIHVGGAIDSLKKLEGQVFDIIFFDADKTEYVKYYETVLELGLLSKKGILIADNTAFDWVTAYYGAHLPIDKDYKPLNTCTAPDLVSGSGKALHEFNEVSSNMTFDVTNKSPTQHEIKYASEEQLRDYYAAKESINPSLDIPSIPPTIPEVYQNTLSKYGPRVANLAISHFQGVIQNFFVGLVNAKRVLEIGTFTGTSAIYFANALKRNGVTRASDPEQRAPVIGLDISEEYAQHARENFVKAGVDDYIEMIIGDARESLAKLEGQVFDVIFIDADKNSYRAYYNMIIEKKLLAKSGLIMIDNTALEFVTPYIDKPTDDEETAYIESLPFSEITNEQSGRALHDFNEYIRADPRTEVMMLPIFTGVTLVRLLNRE